jgi:hypothetical protein
MRFCIADPPYLGRAVRWYGEGGCGDGKGIGQADNHPEAHIWDDPETHRLLVRNLEKDFDGWAIAMSVHSLSTYLAEVGTDSRNGIRVCVWHKPSSSPSGSRIGNYWEPVLVKVPQERRGYSSGIKTKDVLSCNSRKIGFVGSKPYEWTRWVLDLMGYNPELDEVEDLFHGSGSVKEAIAQSTLI